MKDDGKLALRSEQLRKALEDALAGRTARLGQLLALHGGLPGSKANLPLAAAFGEAVAGEGERARAVLGELSREEAEARSPRAFLPIAAAYGYTARLEHDPRDAWAGLFELTADDRAPVRIGLTAALSAFVARRQGNLDALIAQAAAWLDADDREHAYASQAIVLDVVTDRRGLGGLEDPNGLLEWMARLLEHVAHAPRAAERSLARRKVLAALPSALAEAAASTHEGVSWLAERIAETPHPDLRAVFERTLEQLRRSPRAQSVEVLETLRAAIDATEKPPRDPGRIRPSKGRGRRARRRSR